MPREEGSSRLPGLHRGFPLIFLGLALLVAALYLHLAAPNSAIGSFPVWLYCLPVGIVALVGGVATSFFPESPAPIRPGTPVADGLIAVRASDWLAIQRLLRSAANRTSAPAASASGAPGGGTTAPARSTAAPSGAPGIPAKDLMATSFAFAPAFAEGSSSSRRKRGGGPPKDEPASADVAPAETPPATTASTGP